jgi:hypothetical protein
VSLPLLAAVLAAAAPAARAEVPSAAGARAPSVVKAAGPHYQAGRVHRFLFGDDYRDLWTLPFEVEVLDLAAFAGGLEPVRRVGAGQSSGLALRGADGRAYTFRSVEKDTLRGLPPDLRDTIAGRIAQDQTAALHPAAAVVAAPLLQAAGVLHVDARLVVMPDDARLGEFRRDFAGVLGTIQEFPRAGGPGEPAFAGAADLVTARQLLKLLRATPRERADSRAYLRARLVDLFLGDWDRHLDQWRWAKRPGDARWQPIPEDRDFAFCRFEGLVLVVVRNWYPRWVAFEDDYPDMLGLTWQAWPLDRLVLADLEEPEWTAIAADLQRRLGDGVLEDAVARLPAEYRREDGERLLRALRARRDRLPAAAEAFYRHLAEEVDVEGTDEPERVEARAVDGGDLLLEIRAAGGGEPWFRRRFRRDATAEVRVQLRGGDDAFVAHGRSAVRLRVVGGAGDDLLDDSGGGGARLADAEGRNDLRRGPGTAVDLRPYVEPPLVSDPPYMPAREWGRDRTLLPWFTADPDLGVFLGGGVELVRYGFRAHPSRARNVLRAGYAIGANGFRADWRGELRRENSGVHVAVAAHASQIEILRFFGFGNETRAPGPDTFFEVRQTRLSLAPAIHVPLGGGVALEAGPTLEHAWTRRPAGRFISQARPYGSEPFGQLGAAAELVRDTRDEPAAATRGGLLVAGGSFFPAAWDVAEPFGELHAEASTHLRAPLRLKPTLALRAGARRVFGRYPFHEAAFVGGPDTVRGFSSQRFAGDAGAWGNAELRLDLGRYFFVLPGRWGVFGFADAGRVWLDGERSDEWHVGAGGGLWFAYLDPGNAVTIAVARSAERTGFYLRAGFLF